MKASYTFDIPHKLALVSNRQPGNRHQLAAQRRALHTIASAAHFLEICARHSGNRPHSVFSRWHGPPCAQPRLTRVKPTGYR